MLNQLIYLPRIMHLAIFLVLLTNSLTVGRVHAKKNSDINLTGINKSFNHTISILSAQNFLNLSHKLETKDIAQNTSPNAQIIIPDANDINMPTPINPLPNPDDDFNETERIKPDILDEKNQQPNLQKKNWKYLS